MEVGVENARNVREVAWVHLIKVNGKVVHPRPVFAGVILVQGYHLLVAVQCERRAAGRRSVTHDGKVAPYWKQGDGKGSEMEGIGWRVEGEACRAAETGL